MQVSLQEAIKESSDSKSETSSGKKSKMLKWPDNKWETVPYETLIEPIRSLLTKAYNFYPTNQARDGLEYKGFNIGKHELRVLPNPKKRLSKEGLQQESSKSISDILLHITFLLGVEQGRRVEHCNRESIKSIIDTLETYRQSIKDLRIKNDELQSLLNLRASHPNATDSELQTLLKKQMLNSRGKRMQLAKKDLELDASKKPTQKNQGARASFKDLKQAAKLMENKLTLEHWVEYLDENLWTLDDWLKKCVKESFDPKFL